MLSPLIRLAARNQRVFRILCRLTVNRSHLTGIIMIYQFFIDRAGVVYFHLRTIQYATRLQKDGDPC